MTLVTVSLVIVLHARVRGNRTDRHKRHASAGGAIGGDRRTCARDVDGIQYSDAKARQVNKPSTA